MFKDEMNDIFHPLFSLSLAFPLAFSLFFFSSPPSLSLSSSLPPLPLSLYIYNEQK